MNKKTADRKAFQAFLKKQFGKALKKGDVISEGHFVEYEYQGIVFDKGRWKMKTQHIPYWKMHENKDPDISLWSKVWIQDFDFKLGPTNEEELLKCCLEPDLPSIPNHIEAYFKKKIAS
jgi:hypothetical protein